MAAPAFGMENPDDRSLCHRRVTDCGALPVNRRNSLAMGLDHTLGAVGDLHVTIRVDGGDITGIEPRFLTAVIGQKRAIASESGKVRAVSNSAIRRCR